ncbi:Transcription initiation factor TFIID subunit 4b [Zea mays]|uniref:Transcription initiation factor TFIID subunit 4b n=1 Tax=Zea mays TaxID=4577 RepID=A0A1D6KM89_MAIZE|nr:Transcription initiation factor TFIID subunit 4b [Zea mays]ONM03954.1 Transcription initiation factor TFIID subunit 4b [Zea mays]ONM03955.1 Transcription initiation factor TFIID subunit 4b [Zea mays]ONM03962.1 Transcription initiation factor TFIID subunit 4b [Zea mays]ONM03969.1 Transcription initiation factor TFIID subunit 4b [Zea mays]
MGAHHPYETSYCQHSTNLHKANKMGNMSDGKGVHMLQTHPPNNSIPVQTMQHHVQRPQTSSPVFGANSIHARPFLRPVGGPAAPFRPQMADSNPRAHLIQGAVTTISRSVPKRSIVSGNAPVNQALGSSKVSAGMESQSQQLSAPKPLAATSLSQTQSHGIQEEPKIQGKKQLLFESLPATDLKVRASGM